jgi:phage repressor protein C with HTH and peptisase S24 domain
MLIEEKRTELQNLTKRNVTYDELAPILGVGTANALRNWNYRKRPLKEFEIKKIDEAFNISSTELNTISSDTDSVTIDYYPDVFGSCGNGVFQFSTKREQIAVPKSALFKNFAPGKQYFVINAMGNSMQPLICDKDKLVVENYDGEQIIDNRPYLFCYKDEIFIKRLAKNVDQLMIISENKDYDTRKLTGEQLKDVNIIGLVVGLMRDLR